MAKITAGLKYDLTGEVIFGLTQNPDGGKTDKAIIRKATLLITTDNPASWLDHITGGNSKRGLNHFRWININMGG